MAEKNIAGIVSVPENEPRSHLMTDPKKIMELVGMLEKDPGILTPERRNELVEQSSFTKDFVDSFFLDTSIGRVAGQVASYFGQESPYDGRARKEHVPFGTFNPYAQDLTGYEEYLNEFMGAYNPQEFSRIKNLIDVNKARRMSLEHNDVFWTRMLAQVFDPVNFIAAPAVRGMGFWRAAQKSLPANVIAVGAGEALTAPLDPTATGSETFMNVATGTLFASAFSGVAGLFKGQLGEGPSSRADARYHRAQQEAMQHPDPEVRRAAMADAARPTEREYNATIGKETGIPYDDWILKGAADELPKSDVRLKGLRGEDDYVIRWDADGVQLTAFRREDGKLVPLGKFDSVEALLRQEKANPIGYKRVNSFRDPDAVAWGNSKKADVAGEAVNRSGTQAVDADGVPIRDNDAVDQAHYRWIEMEKETAAFRKAETEARLRADEFEAQHKTLADELNQRQAKAEAAERAGNKKGAGAQRGVIKRKQLERRVAEANQKMRWARHQQGQAQNRLDDAEARKRLVEETGDPDMWDTPGNVAFQTIAGALTGTGQFPWWNLVKTGFRKLLPQAAERFQKTAHQLASNPGLHTKAGFQGEGTGASVEGAAKAWWGMYAQVQEFSDSVYARYAGWGDDMTSAGVWAMNEKKKLGKVARKVAGAVSHKAREANKVVDPEAKISLTDFRAGVGRLLMGQPADALRSELGDEAINAMQQAANRWRELIKNFERQARENGLFPTEQALTKRKGIVTARIDELTRKIVEIADHRQKLIDDRSLEKNRTVDRETGDTRNWRSVEELDLIIANMERRLEGLHDHMAEIDDVITNIKEAKQLGETTDDFFFRIWNREAVRERAPELKEKLRQYFKNNPKSLVGGRWVKNSTDPVHIDARVEEAFDQILGESEFGDSLGMHTIIGGNKHDKLKRKEKAMRERDVELEKNQATHEVGSDEWKVLERERAVLAHRIEAVGKDIEKGAKSSSGGPGTFLHRSIGIKNSEISDFIEQDVVHVMQQYTQRVAPMIEMARKFGDARMDDHLFHLEMATLNDIVRAGPKNADAALKELDARLEDVRVLRDVVLGNYGVPEDPSALTNRLTRVALAWNTLSVMGRTVQMSMTDIAKAVLSRGLIRGFGDLFAYAAQVSAQKSGWNLGAAEVRLAGEAMERVNSTRMMQLHELGGFNANMGKFERKMFGEQGRFFMFNAMSWWTDHAKQFAGTIAQSEIVRISYKVVDGTATEKELAALSTGGIDKAMAKRIVKQHQSLPADEQKLGELMVANTEAWDDIGAKQAFRAAMVDEINRVVFTPGAMDKPKLMSTNMGRLIGQYHAFGFATTQRLLLPSLQHGDKQAASVVAAMVAGGFLIDLVRSKDFGEMSIEDRVFRAVELSGVTGIFLDLNNMIEGASGHEFGIRAALGMEPTFKHSTWATQIGAVAGAAPSQWLNLSYAMFDDAATGHDQARAIRYMAPYNNMLWWNDLSGRLQREAGRTLEEMQQ